MHCVLLHIFQVHLCINLSKALGGALASELVPGLQDVDWGELDYLVVDAPPGTSDEHISIAQFLKGSEVDGAVIVTTPQEVALLDVRKEINFAKKVCLIVSLLKPLSSLCGFLLGCNGRTACTSSNTYEPWLPAWCTWWPVLLNKGLSGLCSILSGGNAVFRLACQSLEWWRTWQASANL